MAGCGSSSSGDEGASASSGSTTTKAAATATATATAEQIKDADGDGIEDPVTVKGALGDALELNGSGLGNKDPSDHTKTKIKVTLSKIKGPFKGYDIKSNRKLIGLQFKFTNTGELVYDNPLPNGKLKLVGGGSGKQTTLIQINGTANPCKNPRVKLKAGKSKSVCIAFEVPKKAKLDTFEYTSDSGYGDTAQWSLAS
ncbi:MAG TPA: hypothetical protein VI300_12125 [Solirubrobacter sp.]